jgi:hypothetical protein
VVLGIGGVFCGGEGAKMEYSVELVSSTTISGGRVGVYQEEERRGS